MKILGEDYLLVTLDFESYYGTGCTLTSLNTFQYLNHEAFTIHGVGVQIEAGNRRWFRDTREALDWIEEEACDDPIALLCQNTQFDGTILHHFYDWHPDLYLDTQCMSKGLFPTESASLEKLCERLWPNDLSMRKGKELVQFRNITTEQLYASEAMLAAMIKYCIGNRAKDQGDVGLTYEAFLRMEPHYPDDELRLIDLHIRMMCNPAFVLNTDLVQECLDEGVAKRNAILKAAGVAASTLSSDAKFARYVQETLGIDLPMKPSPTVKVKDEVTGEEVPKMIPALGKADMGFQEMRAHYPQHEPIWAGRIAAKSTGEITRAERFLETADQCHGMMPVCLNYYGAHCVPGDTEVLTPTGWMALQDWEGGTIAQVDDTQNIVFEQAERFIGPVTDTWLQCDAPYVQCAFTPGHTVPYLTHGSFNWVTAPAENVAQRSSTYLPTSGQLTAMGNITAAQMRVLVMVQADGSFCEDTRQGRQLTVFVKKPRKIERARQLLTAADVPFRELTFASHPGFVRFVVAHRDYPTWLAPERKFFGPWLFDSTVAAREAFIQELQHWDGGLNGEAQWSYYTSVMENADWVATLCHLTGRSASILDKEGRGNRTTSYVVNIRQRSHAITRKQYWSAATAPSRAYCAKTRTGFWLARANGRIFVTGNTGRSSGTEKLNQQNLRRGSKLRRSMGVRTWQVTV